MEYALSLPVVFMVEKVALAGKSRSTGRLWTAPSRGFEETRKAARSVLYSPAGMTARVHLSQTDEYPMANAVVVIEAVPADTPKAPDTQ